MFFQIFQTIKKCFAGKNFFWHVALIAVTALCVLSGFDWTYYEATRNPLLQSICFVAALIGFFVPVAIPILLYAAGKIRNSLRMVNAAAASAQAGLLGLALSSVYKVFTGRVGLPRGLAPADTSRVFRFGIYRGGAFQGWPSSHTSVAFAMSFALVTLFPESRTVRYAALAYALYIGLGVSTTIHWFSDFAAGLILGTVIGITVGKQFLLRLKAKQGKIQAA